LNCKFQQSDTGEEIPVAPGRFALRVGAVAIGLVAAALTTTTGSAATIMPGFGHVLPAGCATPGQILVNPGFESGPTGWTETPDVIGQHASAEPAGSGTWDAWLDGYGTTHTDTLSQTVTITAGCHATFAFLLHIDTAETSRTAADVLTVTLGSTTLATYSNLNAANGYTVRTFDVSRLAGQTVTLNFRGVENAKLQTSFVIDNTSLVLS
jgi:hypothetical protein